MKPAATRALLALCDMPNYLMAWLLAATISFWTAVAVRSYDRRHPNPSRSESPEQ